MSWKELTRRNLAELLDRLGPGITLHVSDDTLRRAFNWPAAKSVANAQKEAEQFATGHECGFLFDPATTTGTFFRAYPREARSEN